MEHAMTGVATAFNIGKHSSLNVFVTGYGETPQSIGDVEIEGSIQLEQRTLGTSYNGDRRRVWRSRINSIMGMKTTIVARNAFRSPGRVEDVPVQRHGEKRTADKAVRATITELLLISSLLY